MSNCSNHQREPISKSRTHSVGDEWIYMDGSTKYWIEFNRIQNGKEIWSFGKIYSDGSGCRSDYAFSYASARKHHYTNGRFKKVKK